MGRLFWKCFLILLLFITVTVGCIIGATSLWRWAVPEQRSFEAEKLALVQQGVATALAYDDTRSARRMLQGWPQSSELPSPYVVDDNDRDLLGRPLAATELASARRHAAASAPFSQLIRSENGHRYLLFVRGSDLQQMQQNAHIKPPPPLLPITTAILISLLCSALLAWRAAKPIRQLRWAFRQLANGRLETRIRGSLGRRRDEISELAGEFDGMAQQLQQLVGAQRRLLHDVSHELRSPLARLQAAIGLARQRPDPARLDSTLERIEREVVRVDTLVGELLTLARLEAGSGSVARERVDLVELLAAIADDAQFEAQAHGRDVRFAADGEFVAEVGAELLYRAFENVIRNAVKYTADGSSVDILAHSSGDQLHITVADRGPGVPEDALQDMFEPFLRVGEDGQGRSGFGLGLAIARRAIESHGGHISAHPRDGGGLEVRISLPAQ
ncbi:ATP-binding protein [Vogesella sp. LIG4]|uniref:HAMP domain-containing sensor histidine kinase n=1 Tax=Vogesella sp. LIG4 TaxID=1192162 RepID=UPI00081FA806|nr:ATP-binding protein [Vogesella sp. LIG4]SCK21615.1 Signal transduction histidine kinase [Vogesella sp. LIG4]